MAYSARQLNRTVTSNNNGILLSNWSRVSLDGSYMERKLPVVCIPDNYGVRELPTVTVWPSANFVVAIPEQNLPNNFGSAHQKF